MKSTVLDWPGRGFESLIVYTYRMQPAGQLYYCAITDDVTQQKVQSVASRARLGVGSSSSYFLSIFEYCVQTIGIITYSCTCTHFFLDLIDGDQPVLLNNLLAETSDDEISKQIIKKLVESHSSSLPEPTNNMPAYVYCHGDHHHAIQHLFGIISWSESASCTN